MLGYRHAFHAGNHADVLKHVTFSFVLAHATRKPKPLYVLDTHAGAGAYDLTGVEAARTGEHRAGIGRLLAALDPAPELFAPYLNLVQRANPMGGLVAYPGSPALAGTLLRAEDRLELAELHPTDHALLAARFRGRPGARVARTDGLALLVARMPPPERRAVVLIDPSYELKSDYAAVVRGLARAHRRFATGIFLLWYPVIERAGVEQLLSAVAAIGMRGLLRLELCPLPDAPGRGMTGSGLIVVNPPWTLPKVAPAGLDWLSVQLAAAGPHRSEWLVPPEEGSGR